MNTFCATAFAAMTAAGLLTGCQQMASTNHQEIKPATMPVHLAAYDRSMPASSTSRPFRKIVRQEGRDDLVVVSRDRYSLIVQGDVRDAVKMLNGDRSSAD